MSTAPSLAVWLELVGVLAAGTAVLVGAAALVARLLKRGVWRQVVWQAATVGLLALVAVELSGTGRGIASWLTESAAPPADGQAVAQPRGTVDPPALREPALGARIEPAPDAEPVAWREAEPAPPTGPRPAESVGLLGAIGWWPGVVWLAGALVVVGRVAVARLLLVVLRRRWTASASARPRSAVAARVMSGARATAVSNGPAAIVKAGPWTASARAGASANATSRGSGHAWPAWRSSAHWPSRPATRRSSRSWTR